MQKIDPVDFFAFLRNIPLYPKVYWASRDEDFIIAAAGSASFEKKAKKFGWRHFIPTQAPEWSDFAPEYFFQPIYEIIYTQSSYFLSQNTREPFNYQWLKKEDHPTAPLTPQKISHLPSQNQWIHLVEKALQSIHQSHFEKVVLSRREQIDFPHPIDPYSLCQAIHSTQHTVFLFQPTPQSTFLGATPERLYRRKNQEIECDALAGTHLLGCNDELMKSEKDFREFLIVKNRIVETLSPYCKKPLTASLPSIRSSKQLCHLYSNIQGTLKENVSDHFLIPLLHPTPALCGYPKQAAQQFLSQNEPFARGLYGAPLGWMNDQEADFAVGIRSCLIHGSSAYIYAGTGIVDGSDPVQEWKESEHKLMQFNKLIHNEQQHLGFQPH